MVRRTLSSMHHIEAMERLTAQLARHESNRQFIEMITRRPALAA